MTETKEEAPKNIYQRLLEVQRKARAPRATDGKFGKARSAEQILEAYKPVCIEHGLYLHTSDEMKQIGERNYVVATAKVVNVDDPTEFVSADASAWENEVEVNKYGAAILDTSQVSGKTSSYAKKYALQNLFAIDDTKDSDQKDSDAEANMLARAKSAINEALEANGFKTVEAKKGYIKEALGHESINNLNEADAVADKLGMK